MKALKCEKLPVVEFNRLLTDRLSEPSYVTDRSEPNSPVTFHFSMKSASLTLSNTILAIYSSKAGRPIYVAPYQEEFVIQAGTDLLSDGGGDSITLAFFKKNTHEVCGFIHESEPFWQANKHVYFELLPFRELNEIGLPVAFKVRIE